MWQCPPPHTFPNLLISLPPLRMNRALSLTPSPLHMLSAWNNLFFPHFPNFYHPLAWISVRKPSATAQSLSPYGWLLSTLHFPFLLVCTLCAWPHFPGSINNLLLFPTLVSRPSLNLLSTRVCMAFNRLRSELNSGESAWSPFVQHAWRSHRVLDAGGKHSSDPEATQG